MLPCNPLSPFPCFPQTVLLVDGQTTQLELATRRALDELTLRVTPRNLERMRALKGRITALSGKVDTVRLGGGGNGEEAQGHPVRGRKSLRVLPGSGRCPCQAHMDTLTALPVPRHVV